jgi:hypothetical protein
MFIALLAVAVTTAGCGLREDTLHCRDFCDKARACNPAMGDAEWDDCLVACQETGHPQEAVDCVLSRQCEIGRFDELVSSCYLNPFAPEPEE